MIFLVVSILNFTVVFAQKNSKIIVDHSDYSDINEIEMPNVILLTGNVRVNHDGIIMTCNKAYYFRDENYIKAFGEVQMVQGDTLYLNSKYAEYSGNVKKAFASGNVVMNSPESTMSTDTLYFDRNLQEAYFNSNGNIVNKKNTLTSKAGRYYVKEKKYQFLKSVVLKNPEYTIKSNHLDYCTKQGDSFLYGPSTITGKDNFIYTENGYYNSKKNTGFFKRKSYIKYKDRLIEGDSLYYDRKIEFASGTNNVKITDSINKAIITGHYGEVYKNKDSLYITKHASIRYMMEKDSMFIHAKKIIVTGKTGERKVTGFNNVRFFKTDLSGKCDSIHSDQKIALTKLIGKPILWNFDKQMTGDIMHLIGNNKTEKLDSLKILNNTFIISKDTIGIGYNQIKGLNLYGKFKENKLYEADVVKNTEVIYYMRTDKNELIGINKSVSSRINLSMDDKTKVESITFFDNEDGDIYPEKDLPENARKLRGFVWRGDERIKTKEDIFPPDEVELDKQIVEVSNKRFEKSVVQAERIQQQDESILNKDDSYYSSIFNNFNNHLIIDRNNQILLIKDGKIKYPKNNKSIYNYKKNNTKYSKEIKLNKVLWDPKTMQFGKFDGGFIEDNEKVVELDIVNKTDLTYDDLFLKYNNRIIINQNWEKFLIKNGKFYYPNSGESFKNYIKLNPRYSKIIKINQVFFDLKTMQFGKYDGGFINDKLKSEDFELSENNDLTFDKLFELYNNRIILNKNWDMFLIKDKKFYYNISRDQFEKYIKQNPNYSKVVKINQELFDLKTMQFGKYDGGFIENLIK
ncbi:OstA-like protein [Flavobacterium sp. SUN046]|nr:OstA-like protein [Flavobacterium sp. SUN046]MEC4048187.1 OstA-like protein [Flavobacterium sp. SUN046]